MKLNCFYITAIAVILLLSGNVLAQSPKVVDLGLSVDWAATNLEASVPEEFGGYFGWADPTGLETTMDVLDDSRNWLSDLYGGIEPPEEISGTNLDLAHIMLGEGWRLPTVAEIEELTDCQHKWTKVNGINGYEIMGKNGNTLFLPAGGARNGEVVRYAGTVGYYWTGTLGTDPLLHKQRAHRLYIGAEGLNHNPAIRYSGYSIRPVKDKNHSEIKGVMGDMSIKDGLIYDLTGRCLGSKPQKGFYIQNGKKHVVR